MTATVHVAGVGMIPFTKPGQSDPYDVMGERAARAALAGRRHRLRSWSSRPTSATSTATRPAARPRVYGVGLTGIPVVNVNNNCATGSSALLLARQAVASGAVGVRARRSASSRCSAGALEGGKLGRPPARRWPAASKAMTGHPGLGRQARPRPPSSSAAPARRTWTSTASPTRPSRRSRSSRASTRPTIRTRSSVTRSPRTRSSARRIMFGPLTRLQCCPPTCGAAAAIVVQRGLRAPPRPATPTS